MREPVLVDHAQIAPQCCRICQNQNGPFVDTYFEDVLGRVYVCKRCAKTFARVCGFAPGKKLDELNDAAVALEGRDAEIAKLVEAQTALTLECGAERATVKELKALLEDARGRLQSTRHMAASIEQASRELVETVAPAVPVGVAA